MRGDATGGQALGRARSARPTDRRAAPDAPGIVAMPWRRGRGQPIDHATSGDRDGRRREARSPVRRGEGPDSGAGRERCPGRPGSIGRGGRIGPLRDRRPDRPAAPDGSARSRRTGSPTRGERRRGRLPDPLRRRARHGPRRRPRRWQTDPRPPSAHDGCGAPGPARPRGRTGRRSTSAVGRAGHSSSASGEDPGDSHDGRGSVITESRSMVPRTDDSCQADSPADPP
jgi:hypothetical protein